MSGAVCNGTLTSGISTKPKFEALLYLYFQYYNYCSFSKYTSSVRLKPLTCSYYCCCPVSAYSPVWQLSRKKNQASLILWAKCMPDIMKRPSFSFPNNTLVEFLEMIVIKLMAISFYLLLTSFFLVSASIFAYMFLF